MPNTNTHADFAEKLKNMQEPLRVFVVGGGVQYLQMFFKEGFLGARSVPDADIVCFTGGSDVSPSYYGEEPIPGTSFNPDRDETESIIYADCLALHKPMVGICRGGQFLNVMNGGKMWQDVNGHALAVGHPLTDVKSNKVWRVTSTHHQMMIPANDGEVLATACEATHKKSWQKERISQNPDNKDVEVVWYDASSCLCFQPHPEFQEGECREYFMELMREYILPCT